MTTSRSAAPHRRWSASRGARGAAPAVATGVDVVDTGRFRRLLDLREPDLCARVFTPAEISASRGEVERLAARFAAKEAAAKALGTGVGPVAWRDVEVRTGPTGRPSLRLSGRARALAHRRRLSRWTVSLTHDGGRAVAVVVATGPGRVP